MTTKRLAPNRLQLAEYKRNLWRIMVDVDVTIDEILQPEFWTHAAKGLRQYDRVEIVCVDGKFFAEVLVTAVLPAGVIVRKISYVEFVKTEPVKSTKQKKEENQLYSIEYKGNINKHSVIRNADKVVLKDGFDTKAQAQDWLDSYELNLIR